VGRGIRRATAVRPAALSMVVCAVDDIQLIAHETFAACQVVACHG
jgi:hypothetical protein